MVSFGRWSSAARLAEGEGISHPNVITVEGICRWREYRLSDAQRADIARRLRDSSGVSIARAGRTRRFYYAGASA